jgi:hypothetical protein
MTWIHLVVLVFDTAVMIAGLLVGPEAAGTAFFAISLGLGAYTAGGGGPATKLRCGREGAPMRAGGPGIR